MTPEDKIKNILGTKAMNYLPYFLIVLVLTVFLFYLGDKLTLNERNCSTLSSLYTSYPLIKSVDYDSDDFDYRLRDFYIKAAYNCCCGGGFKNDYVNVCALENTLKNGARFLDFEIYAKDDMPIIGASSTDEYSYKETYNDLAFKTAMEKVKDVAFSSICPNPEDPIILHFRIKSEKSSICDVMAKDINHTFGQDHLDKLYSYEYRGNNLGDVKLKDLKKKVIVMVDKSENLKFKSTKLYEFVNMCSGTSILRKYRNNDIEHNIDTDEIMTHNKMKMSIVLPDVNTKTDNYSYIHAKEAGIQIMAMNFQNFDSNLKFYSLFFDSAGYAFALKPEDMRSNTVEIETPESSITLPTTTSYGCPATQEACPDLTNTPDPLDLNNTPDPPDLTDDNDGKTGDKWNTETKTGKWKRTLKLDEFENLVDGIKNAMTFTDLYNKIHKNEIYEWTGDVTEKNQGRKHYVKKCNDFDGVPGITFFDQSIWTNLYNFYFQPHNTNNLSSKRINMFSVDDTKNPNSTFTQYAEKYCNNAVYEDENGEERKCTYKGVVKKGIRRWENLKGKKKPTIQGSLNAAFEDYQKDKEYNQGKNPFWVVKCKKRD